MDEYFECDAIRVQQPSATFYVASVKASELETICRPLKEAPKDGLLGNEVTEPETLTETELSALLESLESPRFQKRNSQLLSEVRKEPYQRFVDERRSVEIANYLKEPDSLLPNSIILAVNVDLDENTIFEKVNDNLVRIKLPRSTTSAVILDGQHRVAAFRYLPPSIKEDFQVIVTFLVGVPFYQQAAIFAVINGKQKAVNKSIIFDLFGYAPIGGVDEERLYEGLVAVSRFCSHVTRILNSAKESPWQNKIKMRGPGDAGVISQAAVVEYLSPLIEPKKLSKRLRTLPLLYEFFKDSNPSGCAVTLIIYLRAIQATQQEHWNNPTSLFWKNNGVAVMLRLMLDEILLSGSAKGLIQDYQRVTTHWDLAPQKRLADPPKTGGGGVQNELYEEFKAAMFSDAEQTLLTQKRDQLKDSLLEIGGLIK